MASLNEVKELSHGDSSYIKEIKDLSMKQCPLCKVDTCDVWMRGYGYDLNKKEIHDILLCRECAMQLLRKLAEDICEYTRGGRHG